MAFVSSDGIDIYYEVHGDAPETIVMAHGMGGNAAIWYNQIAHFRDRYKIIAFDHRYFARSGGDAEDFKPERFPQDALKILAAEGIERAIWMCQSMGGWTGSQMALQHPEKVQALIMSHTPGVFEHASAVNDTSRVAEVVATGNLPALAADFPAKQPALATLYLSISNFNDIENPVIPRKIGEAKLGVNIENLEAYGVPTLFITGEQDVLFSADYIEALARVLPGAKFTNLGDVGHSSYFELPEAFNAAVDEFLRAL